MGGHIHPQPSTTKYLCRVVAHGIEHNATVWRLAWNVTGTILASSGDDGAIRLWKGIHLIKLIQLFRL